LVAGVGHALLLRLLCVVQTLLRLLALLLSGLLLLAVLRGLCALHRMKLRIKLIECLREHLALQLFQRRGKHGRRGLAG
jgi:hypothetical protein